MLRLHAWVAAGYNIDWRICCLCYVWCGVFLILTGLSYDFGLICFMFVLTFARLGLSWFWFLSLLIFVFWCLWFRFWFGFLGLCLFGLGLSALCVFLGRIILVTYGFAWVWV